MIGATTLSEYKEYIQEDAALARRFRTVQVAEPSIDESRRILYSLQPRFERNYAVRLTMRHRDRPRNVAALPNGTCTCLTR
jgi:ATP-dependent Clp protease ATP-binding subunit ClpA